jgi:glycosidase
MLSPEAPSHAYAEGNTLAEKMSRIRQYEANVPADSLLFCYLDNHDTAVDDDGNRFDMVRPVEAGNAAFVLTFLRRGLPLIFNGNEVADNAFSAMLAPVEHPLRANKTVDWGRALQPAGQKRLAHIRSLAKLRHEMPVFADGSQEWVTDGEAKGVVSFVRRLGDVAVFVAANLTDKAVSFRMTGIRPIGEKPLLAEYGMLSGDGTCDLGAWGYVVWAVQPMHAWRSEGR